MSNILVAGGAGYIGSHTVVELLNEGHRVVIVDNFSNSKPEVLKRITELTGKPYQFYEVDLQDREALDRVFDTEKDIDAVIHFAAFKAVGESVLEPLKYYQHNLVSTMVLLECMAAHKVKNIVFSSTAGVYGLNNPSPLTETLPLSASSPYGRTKLMIEEILGDLADADPEWSVAVLRYFNAVGAHESGRIGEDPSGVPSNLMPYITQVAVGKLSELHIFGNDYETPDGTCIRDYIHVTDLARGHLQALKNLYTRKGLEAFNLGTGTGNSVLEVLKTFETINNVTVPHKIVGRRAGDVATNFADPSKAERELDWRAERSMSKICEDAWRWQVQNPKGYE